MKKCFVVFRGETVLYPPVLSVINLMLELGYQVIHMGNYNDPEMKKKLGARGVVFKTFRYNVNASSVVKFFQAGRFVRKVRKAIKQEYKEGDIIWIIGTETACMLGDVVKNYKTVVHFLEFTKPNISWRYRIYNPMNTLAKVAQSAYKVVCCEYNRAHITKGMLDLECLPDILPNKLYVNEEKKISVPEEYQQEIDDLKRAALGKKIILYQGALVGKERRLDEYINAVNVLGNDYCLVILGRQNTLFDNLKRKYSSEKIIFLKFIKPPYHLLVTELAYIGILSYFPSSKNIGEVINPIYCAPNKIFEYSKFGVPMISNDLPGLSGIFEKYFCGRTITYPITSEKICAEISFISNHYEQYTNGSKCYYESVDMLSIVKNIIN